MNPRSLARDEQLLCAACNLPVIGLDIHQHEGCVAQRREFGCLSNSICAPAPGSAYNALRCRMGCGHFVPASVQVCDCCAYGLFDNSAKADLLATSASERHLALANVIVATAPRFSAMIALCGSLTADTRNAPTDREV